MIDHEQEIDERREAQTEVIDLSGAEDHLSGANGGEPTAAADLERPEPELDAEPEPDLDEEPEPDLDEEPEEAEPEPGPASETDAAPTDEDPASTVVRLDGDTVAEALPAIARVAADAWLRAAAWGVGTSLRLSARLARAATDPTAAADLYQDVAAGLRSYAREFLGITDLDDRVKQLTPLAGTAAVAAANGGDAEELLRAQGAELLRQAADVGFNERAHPAYARILTELAPDEGRILRVLAVDGPQAMVDIRAANLIGLGSQLVAPGMNMIGAQAGLRWRDRVPAYLNNLSRLGLIFLSDEAVEDAVAYQVLEAQPEVLGTLKETPRAKSVHRSIHLSPFGLDFCEVCLPLDGVATRTATPPPQLPRGNGDGE